jgi:hypothetical protein
MVSAGKHCLQLLHSWGILGIEGCGMISRLDIQNGITERQLLQGFSFVGGQNRKLYPAPERSVYAAQSSYSKELSYSKEGTGL